MYYMKLIIYIILFIILIIYINNQSIEQFTNNQEGRVSYLSQSDKQKYVSITDNKELIAPPSISINNTKYPQMSMHNPYISINQYNANYNPYFKSHLNNSYFDNVTPYNDTNSISYKFNMDTSSKIGGSNWVVKESGYSDIFNDEDIGGDQINNILNNPKPVVFLDKTMTNINTKIPMTNSKWFNYAPTSMSKPNDYQKNGQKLKQPTVMNSSSTLQELSQQSFPILDTHSVNFVYDNIQNPLAKPNKKVLTFSDTIINNNNKYHLLGIAYNHSYNQYYLIYESIIQQNYDNLMLKNNMSNLIQQDDDNLILKDNMSNMHLQLYNYALVQIENNKEIIKYIFGPRDKINYNDIVYFHKGFIQLGPFIINNI